MDQGEEKEVAVGVALRTPASRDTERDKQKERQGQIRQFYGRFRSIARELEDYSRQSKISLDHEIQKCMKQIEETQSLEVKAILASVLFGLSNSRSGDADRIINMSFFQWLVDIAEIQDKWIRAFAPQLKGYGKLSREMKSYAPILKKLRKMIKQKKTGAGTYTDFFENIWKRQKQRGMIV